MPVEELLVQLRDPDPLIRFAAAAALDDIDTTPEIERALIAASKDVDAKVRRAAMHSLSCAHCKPDGCLGPAAVDVLIDALLHDPSIRNRRWAAGVTMWNQAGQPDRLVTAYREVMATTDDRILRERGAAFLANHDVPRGDRGYREWLADWRPRYEELLASA